MPIRGLEQLGVPGFAARLAVIAEATVCYSAFVLALSSRSSSRPAAASSRP